MGILIVGTPSERPSLPSSPSLGPSRSTEEAVESKNLERKSAGRLEPTIGSNLFSFAQDLVFTAWCYGPVQCRKQSSLHNVASAPNVAGTLQETRAKVLYVSFYIQLNLKQAAGLDLERAKSLSVV